MRENICKWSIWQGINLQNTQTDHSGQHQGNKQWAEDLNKHFSKKTFRWLKTTWKMFIMTNYSVQFSSVTQSCLTHCDPMNRSKPGLPVHHQLPEFTQTNVHRVSDAIQPSHPLSSPSPPALNPSQHQSLFQWVNSSHEVAKVLEFQLQHHSLQRNLRADLLQNGLVGSPCSPRDSQESSPTPQFKRIPGLKNLNTDFKNITFNSLFTLKEHTRAVNQKIESSLSICWSTYIFPSMFHHRNLYVAYILSVRCTRLF